VAAQFTNRIADDQPAFLCIGQQGAKAAHHVFDYGGRAVLLTQLVLEVADRRSVELRQLRAPDDRLDVQPKVLTVLIKRGAFQLPCLGALEP